MRAAPDCLSARLVRDIEVPFWHQAGSGVGPQPLLIWLHGAGAKGIAVERLSEEPIFSSAQHYAPMLSVIAPVCPAARSGWDVGVLMALIDHAIAAGWADPNRVVVAGTSMGGRGAYEVAYEHADRLAAVIAIAAAGLPTLMPRLRGLPCWIAHGSDDSIVPVAWARWVAEAYPQAIYQELAGIGHDCTAAVVNDTKMWQWLEPIL